jgi:hypothetical protein
MDNIEDILNDVVKKLSLKQPDIHNKIERIWINTITDTEKKHTQIQKFENNCLFVNVTSPILLHQLKKKKSRILERIKEEISDVQKIIFRIGKV